jgi:hypothetical protein
MTVRFLRVLGARSAATPGILAIVDDRYRVRWDPRRDWTCTCDEDTFPTCPHIDAVEALIDPRIYTTKKPGHR